MKRTQHIRGKHKQHCKEESAACERNRRKIQRSIRQCGKKTEAALNNKEHRTRRNGKHCRKTGERYADYQNCNAKHHHKRKQRYGNKVARNEIQRQAAEICSLKRSSGNACTETGRNRTDSFRSFRTRSSARLTRSTKSTCLRTTSCANTFRQSLSFCVDNSGALPRTPQGNRVPLTFHILIAMQSKSKYKRLFVLMTATERKSLFFSAKSAYSLCISPTTRCRTSKYICPSAVGR